MVRKLAGEGTEEGTGVAREDKSGIVLLAPSNNWNNSSDCTLMHPYSFVVVKTKLASKYNFTALMHIYTFPESKIISYACTKIKIYKSINIVTMYKSQRYCSKK